MVLRKKKCEPPTCIHSVKRKKCVKPSAWNLYRRRVSRLGFTMKEISAKYAKYKADLNSKNPNPECMLYRRHDEKLLKEIQERKRIQRNVRVISRKSRRSQIIYL